MSLGKVPMMVGGGSLAKQRAHTWHAGIHGNSHTHFEVTNKLHNHAQLEREIHLTQENPVCDIMAHGLLITADQHWLDFNLA